MIESPTVVHTETQHTAAIHLTVPRREIREVMGPALGEIGSTLVAQGLAPTGPWFTHHFQRPVDTFDFEVCIPVSASVTPAGRVHPSQWPAMKLARTIYTGPYEGLGSAWAEFHQWIEAQGHTTATGLWERYLVGPDASPDPSSWRTELNLPLTA